MQYTAMESFKEMGRMYQRALRIKPFNTMEKAITYAKKKAKGSAFVCRGVTVVWCE